MFKKIKEEIEALNSIISCKITGDENIDEIHIIADRKREAKKIVRDIETIVMVNRDEEINHKKISIAQLNTDGRGHSRKIKIISIYQEHDTSICHIELSINGEKVKKKVKGTKEDSLPLIVARGIITIIEEYIGFKGKLRVENVFTTGINNEILLLQLLLLYDNFTAKEKLLGAVYINQNLPLAAGKACLKALNRKIISD